MDNNWESGWKQGREVGRAGFWAVVGGKGRKLCLNNNKKNFLKEHRVKQTCSKINVMPLVYMC